MEHTIKAMSNEAVMWYAVDGKSFERAIAKSEIRRRVLILGEHDDFDPIELENLGII